jgi:UDP-N-acetylglucosamine 4,6-dehydratase
MKLFITGGTGSLGTALLEFARANSFDATAYSRDEVKQGLLRRSFPEFKFLLGDVRDEEWLELAMRGHDIVIHAAAYKQVPAAEVNSNQAVSVNVVGSLNVVRASIRAGIQRVVGISSDKACEPVNCYGATKMLMEKLFQEAGTYSDTEFVLARYGNVLGSRGSVVPFFRDQIAKNNIITVTNPAMTRFWLTLNDAVDLVIKAINAPAGTVIVPKCSASTMQVLAEACANSSTEIKVIGTRPGEKVHECLLHSGESMHAVETPDVFQIYPASGGTLGNLPDGFEYTSNIAPQLTVEQLRAII